MTKLKQSIDGCNPGWAINIYTGDRRLLCTLDPSHAWGFVIGFLLGGLMMLSWSRSDRPQPQPASIAAPNNAPLAVD